MIDQLQHNEYYDWKEPAFNPLNGVPQVGHPQVYHQNLATISVGSYATVIDKWDPDKCIFMRTPNANTLALSTPVPFLKWAEGCFNFMAIPPGGEVVTGPMSGCLLVTFRLLGALYAGHVGTSNTSTSQLTLAAWAAWEAYLDSGLIQIVSSFNPFANRVNAQSRFNEAAPVIFGVYKHTGENYAVTLHPRTLPPPQGGGQVPMACRCVGKVQIPTALSAGLRH